jgi:hypothetical protein
MSTVTQKSVVYKCLRLMPFVCLPSLQEHRNNRKSMFRVVMVCTTPQATLQLNSGAICKDRSYIYAGFFVLSACCP